MNVIYNISQMFSGLNDLWFFFQGFWSALPVSCQLLLSFSFGAVMLIGLLKMVT